VPGVAEVNGNLYPLRVLQESEEVMRELTIHLDDEVYSFLEIRAAMDGFRIKEGIENFLSELAMAKKERRDVHFQEAP
jgi:hypothetical protein